MKLSEVLQDSEQSKKFRKVLIQWHGNLQGKPRGERAGLRREKNPFDVYTSNDFRRGIVSRLERKDFEFDEFDLERLALPLGLIAHIKTLDNTEHFCKALCQVG